MLARCAKLSLKAQSLVIAIWIALSAAGVFSGVQLDKHLTTSLEIPGSASAAASNVLQERFLENTEGSFTVLYRYKQATPEQILKFKVSLARAAAVIPGSEITQEKAFAGTQYGKIEDKAPLKQSILARILTGDKSVGTITPMQQKWADWLKTQLPTQ